VVVEEPAYEEERPRKKGMKNRQRMRLANIGLAFHYAKILCIIVALLLYLLMIAVFPIIGVAGAAGSAEGVGAGFGIVQVIGCLSGLLILATPILGGTGSLLCFWVPEKARARVLVIVSFGLEVGGAALVVLGYLLAIGSAVSGSAAAAGSFGLLSLLGLVVSTAGGLSLFLLFLRALAFYLRDDASADEALRQLILFLATFLGGIVVVSVLVFVLVVRGMGGMGGGFVLLAVWIGWIVALTTVFFAILNVIGTLRAKINSRWG
jgi:hypothetical protein